MGALRRWLVHGVGALWLVGCGTPVQAPAARAAPVPATQRTPQAGVALPLVVRDVGFDAPESVLHDEQDDVYLVSNVVGAAAELDDRAFIARVRPDGRVETLKWIDAAAAGVELHAPKGMAIAHDVLYVADVDRVRKFDRATGRVLGAVRIEGATFLHDVAADAEGSIYVSDSGLGAGLAASGTDAIYRIDARDRVHIVARSLELGQPAGLWVAEDGLWVASFGSDELYRLSDAGRRDVQRLAHGSLDGLALARGVLYVSSWEGAAVFRLSARSTDEASVLLRDVHAPADLGLDARRGRLLVTHYNENSLSIHALE